MTRFNSFFINRFKNKILITIKKDNFINTNEYIFHFS